MMNKSTNEALLAANSDLREEADAILVETGLLTILEELLSGS